MAGFLLGPGAIAALAQNEPLFMATPAVEAQSLSGAALSAAAVVSATPTATLVATPTATPYPLPAQGVVAYADPVEPWVHFAWADPSLQSVWIEIAKQGKLLTRLATNRDFREVIWNVQRVKPGPYSFRATWWKDNQAQQQPWQKFKVRGRSVSP